MYSVKRGTGFKRNEALAASTPSLSITFAVECVRGNNRCGFNILLPLNVQGAANSPLTGGNSHFYRRQTKVKARVLRKIECHHLFMRYRVFFFRYPITSIIINIIILKKIFLFFFNWNSKAYTIFLSLLGFHL